MVIDDRCEQSTNDCDEFSGAEQRKFFLCTAANCF